MKPLRILVFLTLLLLSAQASVADDSALPDADVSQQLAEAEKRADNWRIAFCVMTGVYIFVYIMGRRRLVRQIWARNKELKLALDKAQEIEVNLEGANAKTITGQILTSKSEKDFNDFENPNRVQPAPFKDAKLKKGTITVKLPAKSLVLLSVK